MSDTIAQSHMIDLPAGRFHYLSWGAERTDLTGALLLHGIRQLRYPVNHDIAVSG